MSTTFTGKGGDLVLASGSVDQTGTYVFEVKPQSVGQSRTKFTNYWSVANGNDTMFSLFNPTDAAQDILVTFYNGDGSGKYVLPVHLEPQASTMIDMAMLITENKPDASGNVIPVNIHEGSAVFASANGGREWTTLVVAAGVYNVSTATCGEICTNCCGDSNFGISPGSFFCPIGQSMQCTSTATDCYGNAVGGAWSSSNAAIMTVGSGVPTSATVSGVGVGTANVVLSFGNVIVYNGQYCVSDNMSDACPTSSPTGGATGTVNPTVTFSGTPVVPLGGTAPITATVTPSNNTTSISLTLSTITGTGSAIFAGGQTTMTITNTTILTIVGVTGSSTPNNIQLAASIPSEGGGGTLAGTDRADA